MFSLWFFVLGWSAFTHLSAVSPGELIAKTSYQQERGAISSRVFMRMSLMDSNGNIATRLIEMISLEKQQGDWSVISFIEPRDIQGTKLLTKGSSQWIYLPALKRVKRISTSNSNGPFMGSEFSYEDMRGARYEDYRYIHIETNSRHEIIDRYPLSKSHYSKHRVYYDIDHLHINKIEYFNKRDELVKTLTIEDYRRNQGLWRAHRFVMKNHITNKTTELIASNYVLKAGLDDRYFTINRLSR